MIMSGMINVAIKDVFACSAMGFRMEQYNMRLASHFCLFIPMTFSNWMRKLLSVQLLLKNE